MKFKISFGAVLDTPLPSNYVFDGAAMRHALQEWMQQSDRVCLIKAPESSDQIDYDQACAKAILFDSETLDMWCTTLDTPIGNRLEHYLRYNKPHILYLPYGFSFNSEHGTPEFQITCLHLIKKR